MITSHSSSALAACFDYAYGKPRGRVPSQREIKNLLSMIDCLTQRNDALEVRLKRARKRMKMRLLVLALARRVCKQSELLSRKAQKQ